MHNELDVKHRFRLVCHLHLQLKKVHTALCFQNVLYVAVGKRTLLGRNAHSLFLQDTMSKVMPKTPEVFNKIRFPDLDFVEVYNQPPRLDEFEDDEESGFDSVSEHHESFLLIFCKHT